MAQLFTGAFSTTLDANANPSSGALLRFYASGTLTPANVYADAALTTSLGSEIAADSAGRYPAIYLDRAISYRVRVCDAAGTIIRDVDPVGDTLAADLASPDGATYINISDNWTLADATRVGVYQVEQDYPANIRAAIIAGTHPTSVSTYIAAAIANANAGNYAALQFGPGVHPVNVAVQGVADLDIIGHPTPGATVIKSLNAMPNIGALGGMHQGQSLWQRGSSTVQDITFDQNGYGGGVVGYDEDDLVCRRVRVINGPNTGGCQAFLFTGCSGALENCYTNRVQFSTQIYGCNRFDTRDCLWTQSACGTFYAGTVDSVITGNKSYDMSDVGHDVEGGRNVQVTNNYAEGCKNGEYALFPDLTGASIGCHNISFTNNKYLRRSNYLERDGSGVSVNTACAAIQIQGISAASTLIVIRDNPGVVNTAAGSHLRIDGWGGTGVQDVRIGPNPCRYEGVGPAIATPVGTPGLQLDIDIGCTATQSAASYVKNMAGGSVSGVMRFASTPSDYGLTLYSDTPQAQTCVVDNLKVHGAGSKAVKVDQFNSPVGTYTLGAGCDFNASGALVANGGLTVTSNGVPFARGFTRRKLDSAGGTTSTFDFDADDMIGATASARPKASWTYEIKVAGAVKNVFDGTYASGASTGVVRSRDGTGTGQGQLADASNYVAVSGAVLTGTRAAGANTSTLTITYNSGNI